MNKKITFELLLLTAVALVGIPGALAAVDYSTTIQPIFNAKCNFCHPTSGVSLSSYTATMTSTWSGTLIVTPGNAPNSILYQSVAGLPITGGGIPMPIGGTLTQGEIQSIGDWINQGALAAAPVADTTPPTVAITSPTNGQVVSTATITVSGTASDNVGVTSLTVNGNPVTLTSGAFSTTVTLVSGSNTITVVAKDAAGNSATATVTVTYNPPDTTPPKVTITSPTNGQIVSTATVSVSGTATDNVGVTSLTVNGNPVTITAGTSVSFSTSVTLVSGSNTITVVAKDAAGNSGTSTVTVTYNPPDTTPPTISITSPASGSTVSTATVSVSGIASDNVGLSKVEVKVGAAGNYQLATGTTSWTASVTLVSGSNTIFAKATDTSGNIKETSITVTYTPPDTTPPTVAITSPTNGQIVTTSTISVTGTASDNVGVTSLTVNGNPVTLTSGAFSTTVTLVSGSNTITAVAKDAAGNSATATVTVTYNPPTPADTIPPVVAITSPTDGQIVDTPTVTVSGTASDNVGVTSLTVNGAQVTLASGAFSTTVTLVSGSNTITAIATDAAGNSASSTVTVTYNPPPADTIAPVVAITSPIDGSVVNTSTVTVTGTASDNVGVTSLTVNGNPVTLTSGAFSTTVTLVSGSNTITAVAKDAAGNSATATVTVTYNPPPAPTPTPIDDDEHDDHHRVDH